jgi:hypothetical protein
MLKVVVACIAVALPLARSWAAEHRLASAALHDDRDVARKRERFSAAVPPSVGEQSSWLEVGASSIHCMVVMGASEALMPRLLGQGRPKLPSPLDAVRNSSVESFIMAHHGVGAPL